MGEKQSSIQLVWGLLLVLAGIGVVVRASLLESQIKTVAGHPATEVFIRICFYVMAILLIGGGIRKIRGYLKKS
jgi:hypothetical protein